MGVGKVGIYTAFVMMSLAFYLYSPMPDNAVEPWKYMFVRALIKIATDTAWLGDLLGIGSAVNITRSLTDIHQHLPDDGTLEITDTDFDGVPVRIYKPVTVKKNSPGLIYIHGGGWTVFGIDNYDAFVRKFAKSANMTTVSIEYRLAPENRFPVPLEDCVTAVAHFLVRANKYGVDMDKVFISGDSAGGNLAMAVALKLSTITYKDVPSLRGQILIYPALQAFDFSLPSYKKFYYESGPFIISAQTMVKYWLYYGFGDQTHFDKFISNHHTSQDLKDSIYARYVNESLITSSDKTKEDTLAKKLTKDQFSDEISKLIVNPYFAPLMASDEQLSKLPVTLIVNAEYDVLKDDGWILFHRLQRVKHHVAILECDGLQHGFFVFPLFDFVSVPEKIDLMTEWIHQRLAEDNDVYS